MVGTIDGSRAADLGRLPDWVPVAARSYLSHVVSGRSIRALARERGVHPSTILRQVRQIETRRDDPLVDGAIQALTRAGLAGPSGRSGAAGMPLDPSIAPPKGARREETFPMTRLMHPEPRAAVAEPACAPDPGAPAGDVSAPGVDAAALSDAATDPDSALAREGRRILRRLSEPDAVLVVASGMETAVVVRDTPDGRTVRIAALERGVAEAMALREWIAPAGEGGRIRRYAISSVGRATLKRLLAEAGPRGPAERQAGFAEQHRAWETREIAEDDGRRGQHRYNAAESPVSLLARRRDKAGEPFLPAPLVAAAERLREDFEMAQMGPRVAQNWERLMTGAIDGGAPGSGPAGGPAAARDRVVKALGDLGPGLGDVALRCCCFLEGLETTERRLGWSSRSGKIVLRIALQRLRRHYDEQGSRPPIG